MSKPNDDILAHLTCPVCLAHPEKEVFQCQNGHPICSSCINPLEKCPQCQLQYGDKDKQIRCRVMESLLDSVKLPCVNKGAGCTQRLLRKYLPDHHKICDFRPIGLCALMGNKDCNFAASKTNSLIRHLKSVHNTPLWKGVTWVKFEEKCVSSISPQRGLFLQEYAGDPDRSETISFLILVTLTAEPDGQKLLSFVPIHLHDGHCATQRKVTLSVYVGNAQKKKEQRLLSKWTGLPSNYKDAEELLHYSPLRLSTNYIMKQAKLSKLSKFDLSLDFSLEVKPRPSNRFWRFLTNMFRTKSKSS